MGNTASLVTRQLVSFVNTSLDNSNRLNEVDQFHNNSTNAIEIFTKYLFVRDSEMLLH